MTRGAALVAFSLWQSGVKRGDACSRAQCLFAFSSDARRVIGANS
jgi:hypothetical protein